MHFAVFVLLLTLPPWAVAQSEVERLLGSGVAPAGVVFEIVEADDEALIWALPEVDRLSRRLRERFPGLPIAVVSHGREQFGLLARAADGPLAPVHGVARSLLAHGVDLHVCGTHAGWFGHGPESFPAYVDVSPSGPAQINDYRDLGYVLVPLRRAD